MKAILAIVGIVLLAVVAWVFVKYRAIQQAATGPAKEIVSESLEKTGDTWHAKFVSKFDAPLGPSSTRLSPRCSTPSSTPSASPSSRPRT